MAIPFALEPATLGHLVAFVRQRRLAALVVLPPAPGVVPLRRLGQFLPETESWKPPSWVARDILYLGTRATLSARMIQVALAAGYTRISYRTLSGWRRDSLPALALAKLAGKLLASCERLAWRMPGSVVGRIWGRVTDRIYGRRIRAALAVGSIRAVAGDRPRSGLAIACPTLVAGGAERQIVNTALGLAALGVEGVAVLVSRLHRPPGNDFFLAPLQSAGLRVQELRGSEASLWIWEAGSEALGQEPEGRLLLAALDSLPAAFGEEVAQAVLALGGLAPAVVHCWLDYSNVRLGLAAVLAGVPRIVLSGRNVSPLHLSYIHEPFMRAAYRVLLERPETVLLNNSRGGAADYARWLDLPVERVQVLYNGMDAGGMVRAAPEAIAAERERLGVAPGAPLIGGLMRLSAEKRPMLWLETAALVLQERPDARFALFGAGPMDRRMRAWLAARGLGGRVLVAPPRPDSALALSAFDLLLLTSRWEGTPNVAIESQAVGTPVVATGGGGSCEAIDPGSTGLFVERARPQALAQAVLALLADPARRGAMGAAGPAFVHGRFAMETMLRETLSVYGPGLGILSDNLRSAGPAGAPAVEPSVA